MGWVYVLKAHINAGYGQSLVKIGMSNKGDFHDRVESIQREWLKTRRIEVSILAIEQCQNALNVEQELHHKFMSYSATIDQIRQALGGSCSGDSEWFLVPDGLINQRIKAAADRLSDYPDIGSNVGSDDDGGFPWLGLAAIIAVILGIVAVRGANPAPPPLTVHAPNYAGVNIRQSPNGKIIGFAPNGSKMAVKGRSAGWCAIDPGAWVWCDYLN